MNSSQQQDRFDPLEKGSLSEMDDDRSQLDEEAALRLARVEEFREQILQHSDPFTACVGGSTAGLMEIGVLFEKAFREVLVNTDGPVLESPEISQAMKTFLNLSRELARKENLLTRLREAGQDARSGNSSRRPAGVPDALRRPR